MKLDPRIYAHLALQVYSDAPDIGRADSSARAIVRQTDDGQVFAIPGTNNLACWLADLDCSRMRTILGLVHCGFNDAARSIYGDVRAIATRNAVLCGHSEGAALALILAGLLCVDGTPPAAVFAFEPPRCCADDVLAGILRAAGVKLLLTQNGHDVVPMVPRLLFDWRHPGPLTQIGAAALPVPNVHDHDMATVARAVDGYVAAHLLA